MHIWTEENESSGQWGWYKKQELTWLRARTRKRSVGAFRHLKRLFFSENQSERSKQEEAEAQTKSKEGKGRRGKKKARYAEKNNAIPAAEAPAPGPAPAAAPSQKRLKIVVGSKLQL